MVAGDTPGGGNGGTPAIGTGETAAALTALFPAFALALISMLARSSGLIDGEAACTAAEAAWLLLFPTSDLVLGRVRFGTTG